ncbi:MAG: hypothetical protein P4K83_05695 [Terracidiphilus sp.]|nr:hypothetical protein [Terracidiphilus sp.]
MSDHQEDQDTLHNAPEPGGSSMHTSGAETLLSAPSFSFKLTAEFTVEAIGATEYLQKPSLLPEERRLFLTMLTTPTVLNQICRIAILTEFDSNPGLFQNQFRGFSGEDILAPALPYLSEGDQTFWQRSRIDSPEITGDRHLMILDAFETLLEYVVLEDMTTGERVPLHCSRQNGTERSDKPV